MYCSNCGNQMRETDIFCSKCGHKKSTENKLKAPLKEEVVFNVSPQKEKPISFADQENSFSSYEKDGEPTFRAPRQAHQSVNNAKKPELDDFIWNVHDFPEPGTREIEEIDFKWDEVIQPEKEKPTPPSTPKSEEFVAGSKFHTYNKNREEFQELLDKEYLRQNRAPDYPIDRVVPNGYPTFDPVDHVKAMEREREETPGYYKDWNGYKEDCKKFDTIELERDLIQPEMLDVFKTQVIEKIKPGDENYMNPDDDFDIKKTQFILNGDLNESPIKTDKETDLVNTPTPGSWDYLRDYMNSDLEETDESQDESQEDVTSESTIEDVDISNVADQLIDTLPAEEHPTMGEVEQPFNVDEEQPTMGEVEQASNVYEEQPTELALEEPIEEFDENLAKEGVEEQTITSFDMPVDVSLEASEEKEDIEIEKASTPSVDERLSKLWDSDTAPVPVASLASKITADKKNLSVNSGADIPHDGVENTYGEDDVKSGGKGAFFGKLIIAIIIIVLIIEGSILGLRNFAPESEATAKANQVILTLQTWIEDTFFDKK